MPEVDRRPAPLLIRIERRLVMGNIPAHCPELGPCEVWTGSTYRGYGKISGKRGKPYAYVHRARWIATFGEIPDDIYVCHKCDNPPCARLSHLFLGTQGQNLSDMISKGRHPQVAVYRLKEQKARDDFNSGLMVMRTNRRNLILRDA